jgi:hypothetical protein
MRSRRKKRGGYRCLVEAMAAYTQIEQVQVASCEPLHDLAQLNSDTKKRIVKAGGIDRIMDAVEGKKR